MRLDKKKFFKLSIISVATLFVSDSIVLSCKEANYHFTTSGSYAFEAANHGNAIAAFNLYLTTKNLTYLKQAALLDHSEAAWRLFNVLPEHAKNQKQFWLNRAVLLKQPNAMLFKLEQRIMNKTWGEAFNLYQQLQKELQNDIEKDLANGLVASKLSLDSEQQQKLRHFEAVLKLKLHAFQSQHENLNTFTRAAENNYIVGHNNSLKSAANNKFYYTDIKTALKVNSEKPNLSCKLNVLVVSENQPLAAKANQLIHAFYKRIPNVEQSICFSNSIIDYRLTHYCGTDESSRIECHLPSISLLSNTIIKTADVEPYSHVLVLSNKGKANTRGPIIMLDQNDTVNVLIHEVGHWLSLYDEYPIHSSQQALFCNADKPTRLGLNLVVAPSELSKDEVESFAGQKVWKTNTCIGTASQAYKRYEFTSPMEYFDYDFPKHYLRYYLNPQINPLHPTLNELSE